MAGIYTINHNAIVVATAITIIQYKAGAANKARVVRFSISQGLSETSTQEQIQLLRKTVAATVTSFTPLILAEGAGTEVVAAAVGGTSATGTNASAEGTDGDILYRWSVSVQAGGGLQIWFPEGLVQVGAAGIVALKLNNTITSATLTVTMQFSEFG